MLTLYYGKENIDKERFIFENMNSSAYVIIPSSYTEEAEIQALSYYNKKAIVGIEFISLSRLAKSILSALNRSSSVKIEPLLSQILLYKILKIETLPLHSYDGVKESPSFITIANDFVSELKKHNTSIDDVTTLLSREDIPENFRKKLCDIVTIYSKYENVSNGIFSDASDALRSATSSLSSCDSLYDKEIWIYEYDNLTPVEIQFIVELSLHAKSVNVVLTSDNEKMEEKEGVEVSDWDFIAADIFTLTNRTLDQFETLARVKNASFCQKAIDDYCCNSMLLEENITIVKAANLYNEAETVASFVSNLIYEHNYKYKDIAIICNDNSSMIPILIQVFDEYGLHINTDKKRKLSSSPISLLIMTFLNILTDGFSTEEIMNGLKTNLSNLSLTNTDKLENYALRYGIDGDLWRSPFKEGKDSTLFDELRTQATLPYGDFILGTSNIKTCREFVEYFYHFLFEDYGLKEKIQSSSLQVAMEIDNRDTPLNEENIAAAVLNTIIQIIDLVATHLGEDSYDPKMMRDIFRIGLENTSITIAPKSTDVIALGSLESIKFSHRKTVVIVGANEGILPSVAPNSNFFNPIDRDYFADGKKRFCFSGDTSELLQKLTLYKVLSRATDQVFISYSSADNSGKELRQSEIIDSLLKTFPNIKEKQDILNRGESFEQLSGRINTLRHISSKIRDTAHFSPMWKSAHNWVSQNETTRMNKIKNSVNYDAIKEPILPSLVDSLYIKPGNPNFSFSPSRLERYSRCPFSHFMLYGLKPEENRIHEVASREIGDFYHEVLMIFVRLLCSNRTISDILNEDSFSFSKSDYKNPVEINSPQSNWGNVSKEQCCDLVDKITSDISKRYMNGLFVNGKEQLYRLSRIKKICSMICWIIVLHVKEGAISSIKVETPFGIGKEIPSIRIEMESDDNIPQIQDDNNKEIHIEGKIDRADYLANGSVKIIDYKTGNTKYNLDEIEKGYSLQLITYLIAAKQICKSSAGAYYFKTKDASRNSSYPLENDIYDSNLLKQYRMDGITEGTIEKIACIDKNIVGRSLIIPINEKDGEYKASTKNSVVNDLNEIEETVLSHIKTISKEIVEGKVDIRPKRIGDSFPCKFCQFIGICKFDTNNYQCKYERL